MDKGKPRSLVERGMSAELTGVDGSVEGGLRPFPGFQIAHEFDVTGWGSNHNVSSEILDVFPVDFKVGEAGYGYGFIYRVRRKGSGTADIFFDYWESTVGEWKRSKLVKAAVALDRRTAIESWEGNPSLYPDTGRTMSVARWGSLIYVFVEETDPFTVQVSADDVTTPVVRANPGPGIQPILLSADKGGALGSIVSTGDADRPGKGQLFLTEFYPSEVSGAGLTQTDGDVRSVESGDYAVAYLLQNSETGLRSGLSEVAQIRWSDFDLDGTGLGPTLERVNLAIEICYDESRFDRALIYRSVRTQAAGGTYIAGILHLEAIIDLADYHSNATDDPPLDGNDFAQSIYFVEKDDKQLVSQETFEDRVLFDENMPKGGVAYWYESTMLVTGIRGATTSSSIAVRSTDVLRNMGEIRWSSLTDVSPELFPAENRYLPPIPNNRVEVFKPVGPNVVGFSADRQYLIRKEGAYLRVLPMHEGYGVVGERAADSVGSLIYFMGQSGLKAVSSDGQLDDVASLNEVAADDWKQSMHAVSIAYDTRLACLFIHNGRERETYVLWFNTSKVTRLEDMRFQLVVRGVWPSGFIWDPSLSTGGGFNKSYRGRLEERAFFVQNPVKNSSTDTPLSAKFRLWIVDDMGVRTQKAGLHTGERRRTLLDYTGSSTLRVQAAFSSGTTINLSSGATSTITDADMTGCCLHVLEAADKSLEGKRAWIRDSAVAAAVSLESATASELYGLAVGDVVAVSPVVFRWVPSGMWVPQQGNPLGGEENHFWVKRVDSAGISLSQVEGLSGQVELTKPTFFLLTYKGDQETWSTRNPPIKSDGTRDSLREGESVMFAAPASSTDVQRMGNQGTIMVPGIEIRHPDCSFRVLSMLVLGGVVATERSTRADA
jgi:hypothetical protein